MSNIMLSVDSLKLQDTINTEELLWCLFPEVLSATQSQIDHNSKEIISIIDKFNFAEELDKYRSDIVSIGRLRRIMRAIGVSYIISNRYDKFDSIISNQSDDIKRCFVEEVISAFNDCPTEFDRYQLNIPMDFFNLQINLGINGSDLYIPTKNLKSFKDLYDNIFIPYVKNIDFASFLSKMPRKVLRNLVLDVESSLLVNSLASVPTFVIDCLSLENIEALLALDSNLYDIAEITIGNNTCATFTEKTLDEYLSRTTSDRRSFYYHAIPSEALTFNIVMKHIERLSQEYNFISNIENNYNLKDVLKFLEEECV